MPFMDGTGPLGNGPGAGRGRGTCGGGRRGVGQGTGLGRGTGRGTGFGRQQANGAAQDPKTALAQQAGFLERQLDRIKRQLSGLGGGQPSK
jgi:hypothetical protein